MQDVTSDPPDILQHDHTEVQCMKKDGFFDSPVTQPRKQRKQNGSRNQKSTFCMP